jgi:hypothetical protein
LQIGLDGSLVFCGWILRAVRNPTRNELFPVRRLLGDFPAASMRGSKSLPGDNLQRNC